MSSSLESTRFLEPDVSTERHLDKAADKSSPKMPSTERSGASLQDQTSSAEMSSSEKPDVFELGELSKKASGCEEPQQGEVGHNRSRC